MLADGADVNARTRDGLTPLMRAAWGKHAAAVLELLIAHGAGVNAVNNHGETALIKAAWSGCVENLEVLLEHGADPEVQDTWGQTALDVAERFRNRAAAAFLRSRKTDRSSGETPARREVREGRASPWPVPRV